MRCEGGSVAGYRTVAPTYDALATLYSGGAIPGVKGSQRRFLPHRGRVLYAGVGTGKDALGAARTGLDVVAVDRSCSMLERLRGRVARSPDLDRPFLEIRHEEILDHRPTQNYDAIVANFFLNTFAAPQLESVLSHLDQILAPNGVLIVGDFAAPAAARAARPIQTAYHHLPMFVFSWLTGSERHAIHDYPSRLTERGFALLERETHRVARWGPAWFETLLFGRDGEGADE